MVRELFASGGIRKCDQNINLYTFFTSSRKACLVTWLIEILAYLFLPSRTLTMSLRPGIASRPFSEEFWLQVHSWPLLVRPEAPMWGWGQNHVHSVQLGLEQNQLGHVEDSHGRTLKKLKQSEKYWLESYKVLTLETGENNSLAVSQSLCQVSK